MKFTLGWLREHLDTQASLEDILVALTDIGLEVEGVENPAERLSGFRVAKVLSADRHPQADKLQVLTIDAGNGDSLQVVCGAPNARSGLIGVFGAEGAVVPTNGMVLRKAAIRGVESNGMMCSTRELELGEDHEGIIELPADAPVGTPFAVYAGLDDPVIDVSITPNRQDCMGVRGIARDLAAKGIGTLRTLTVPAIADIGPAPAIRIDDAEGCPALFARAVEGVCNGDAPEWMQRRLRAVGQKPISALVDITNYVMIDHGRPLHVYDLDRVDGPLVVRKADAGEEVTALNGRSYAIPEGATIIADDRGAHDIAGIMGGERTGAAATTTRVLIECAYFTPEGIARTGQALALASDARTRFERGVDPAFLGHGLDIATDLVLRLCGGEASAMACAGSPPLKKTNVRYDPTLCNRLGGIDLPSDQQREILQRLGFTVAADWTVTVPSWRRDVYGPADLVEEVVRIHGLIHVMPVPLPRAPGVARPTATPEQLAERRIRRAAASRGFNEAVNWSFLSEREATLVGDDGSLAAWVLANPISEDLKVMRPSLLPGLLSAAARNADRGAPGVRMFEIGRCYFRNTDGSSRERQTLGFVLAGESSPRDWQHGKARSFDAFDAKSETLALLAAAGAPVQNLQMMPPEEGAEGARFHPGQSGTLRLGPKIVLAAYGVLHPRLVKAFGLSGTVAAAELYLDAIPAKRRRGFMRPAYAPPILQAVTRDFAFLVPDTLDADALVRAVRASDKANITAARVFDLFVGPGVPEGQKSLAVEVMLQPGEKSFGEDDLKAVADRIVKAAAKLGATLRG